jgi:membrane-bound serine protease (ClpP class)
MCKRFDIYLIKRATTDWGKVLILLLDDAIVVAGIIFALRFFGINIPLPITITIATIGGIFVFIIHVAVMPSFHRKQITGREGMTGLQGKVIESLTPFGTIFVKGEHWKAKSLYDKIEVNADVEIVGIDGLTLMVKRQSL